MPGSLPCDRNVRVTVSVSSSDTLDGQYGGRGDGCTTVSTALNVPVGEHPDAAVAIRLPELIGMQLRPSCLACLRALHPVAFAVGEAVECFGLRSRRIRQL